MDKIGSVTQRPDLGVAVQAIMLDQVLKEVIGTKVLRMTPVQEKEGTFTFLPYGAQARADADLKRDPQGDYNRDANVYKPVEYKCKEYGHEELLDDSEARLYSSFFNAELATSEFAAIRLMLAQERRNSKYLQSATTFSGHTAGVSIPWSTSATAVPWENVEAAKSSLRGKCGKKGNALALSYTAFRNALKTTEVRTKMQYTKPVETLPMDVQMQLLADYFGVKYLRVGEAMYNSAAKKVNGDVTLADCWGATTALLYVEAETDNLREDCLGRTLLWTADSPENCTMESYREDKKRSNVYRARHHVDPKIINLDCGWLMTGL